MEGEFTGVSVQTNAADAAGQQSGQEAAAQAQVQQQPANVPDAQGQGTQEETFDSLIRGRYKQDFDSAVQKVVKAARARAEPVQGAGRGDGANH